MSDVLHHTQLTPTLSGIAAQRARFLAKINEQAAKRKPEPVVIQCLEPVAVPVPVIVWKSPDDAAFGPIVFRKPRKPQRPPLWAIVKATADHFRISENDILSQRREHFIVRARQTAMYLGLTLTLRSMSEVGREMGDRDHTTVLHASRKVQGHILSGDQEIIEAIDKLTAQFAVQA